MKSLALLVLLLLLVVAAVAPSKASACDQLGLSVRGDAGCFSSGLQYQAFAAPACVSHFGVRAFAAQPLVVRQKIIVKERRQGILGGIFNRDRGGRNRSNVQVNVY